MITRCAIDRVALDFDLVPSEYEIGFTAGERVALKHLKCGGVVSPASIVPGDIITLDSLLRAGAMHDCALVHP